MLIITIKETKRALEVWYKQFTSHLRKKKKKQKKVRESQLTDWQTYKIDMPKHLLAVPDKLQMSTAK